MIKAVDLIIIAFIILAIFSAFWGKKNKWDRSFSLQTMNCLKGAFAIMIVLFHLSQHIRGGFLFRMIGDTGYLSVAVFFFISGYGMYTRVLQTGGGYCKGIISHRIPKILLPWMIATLIYALYWFAEGGYERIAQICNNRENGYLLITNSWFVITIAVFYLVFYLSFNWCRGNYRKGIKRTLIGIFIYIAVAYLIGLGGWWFYSSLAFVLGMIWKDRESEINNIAMKNWWLFLFSWGIIFAVGYAIRFLNSRTLNSPLVYDAALLIASTAFACLVFSILKKISVNNMLWNFLGGISFEIYLLHELVYNIFRNEKLGIYVRNDFLYVSLVILISVGTAFVYNSLITRRLIHKMLK